MNKKTKWVKIQENEYILDLTTPKFIISNIFTKKYNIKKCPYCNIKGTIHKSLNLDISDTIYYKISCDNKNCKIFIETVETETIEEALKIWNSLKK